MPRIRVYLAAFSAASALALTACSAGSTNPHVVPRPAEQVQQSAEQIASALRLTVQPGYTAWTAATEPNHLLGRQGGYASKVNWGDPNEVNLWGSIEVFPTQAAMMARLQEVDSLAPPFGDGYDFASGDALLRLGAPYTPSAAKALGAQFRH